MNTTTKYSLSILIVVLLAGCSAAKTPAENADTGDVQLRSQASSSVDHHEGEINVLPHDDSAASLSADAHVDDPNEPAHGHSSSHDDSNLPPHRH